MQFIFIYLFIKIITLFPRNLSIELTVEAGIAILARTPILFKNYFRF